jgi:Short C-terminal domain
MLGRRNRFTRKKLMNEGTAAPATVLEIADDGMAVTHGSDAYVGNTELVLRTRLRVDPPGEPSFEVQQKFRYPQLSIPSVGTVLNVRFEADDHDKIMIDTDSLPAISPTLSAATGLDLNGLLTTIHEQRAAGADRMEMAEALKASLGISADAGVGLRALQGTPADDRIGNLERLAALHASGALTDEEFAAQKRILLDPPPPA